MSVLEELGLDSAVVDAAEAQSVRPAFEALASDVYKGKVKELATFVTEKGATQLKVVADIDGSDNDITVYQNIKKKDGSANEIGQATFRHILDALQKTAADLTVASENIKAYGKDVPGKVVKGINTIPVTFFVRAIFEEGAKYENYNEIEAYGRADGTNGKGEDLVTVFKEKVAKNPIIKRVAQAASGNAGSQATTTASGVDVNSML